MVLYISKIAGVMELADVPDSKSGVREDMRVRPPPPASHKNLGNDKEIYRYRGFLFALK